MLLIQVLSLLETETARYRGSQLSKGEQNAYCRIYFFVFFFFLLSMYTHSCINSTSEGMVEGTDWLSQRVQESPRRFLKNK